MTIAIFGALCLIGVAVCAIGAAVAIESQTHLVENGMKAIKESVEESVEDEIDKMKIRKNLLKLGRVWVSSKINKKKLEAEQKQALNYLNIMAITSKNSIINSVVADINKASTDGSSALDDSADIDSQPWPGFAVIDGGGGKEPDKKPDKDPKKTGAKVVASALTAAQLANMLNVSQKQDNTDQVIAPFDPSHITRVTDTGTGQVVIEYKDGTRRIFDKKDVPNHTLASTPIGAEGTNTEGTGKAKIIVTNERLEHSVLGEFNQNNRLINGGHGQENIDYLDANKIPYNIEKEFSNGVRVGNIPSHKNKFKRTGTGQAWFSRKLD